MTVEFSFLFNLLTIPIFGVIFLLVFSKFGSFRYVMFMHLWVLVILFPFFYWLFWKADGRIFIVLSQIRFEFELVTFLSFYFLFLFLFIVLFAFDEFPSHENMSILFFLLFFCLCLISSFDLLSFLLLLECVSVCVIIFVFRGGYEFSFSTALQYTVISLVSTSLFILGILFLYAQWGVFAFDDLVLLRFSLPLDSFIHWFDFIGLSIIVAAFVIKLGFFPAHRWLLDVYVGLYSQSLWIITVFTKGVVLFSFSHLFRIFYPFPYFLLDLLILFSCVSILLASFLLFIEYRTRVFIGLLGLISTGYGVLMVSLLKPSALLLLLYLICQGFSMLFLLIFLTMSSESLEFPQFIYSQIPVYLFKPFLGIVYVVLMFSLIGIPPLMLFLPKFLLLFLLYKKMRFYLFVFILFVSFLNSIVLLRFCRYFLVYDLSLNPPCPIITRSRSLKFQVAAFSFLVLQVVFFFLFLHVMSWDLVSLHMFFNVVC